MNTPILIALIARIAIVAWEGLTFAIFYLSIFNVPVFALFIPHRLVQLCGRTFDERPTRPTHALLHAGAATLYGVIMPVFYFISVRRRGELAMWPLGHDTNTWWTLTAGVLCIAWLASHLVESLFRQGRLRFGPGIIDRAVSLAAVALCLWYHAMTSAAMFEQGLANQSTGIRFFDFLLGVLYPQSCFLGATLVYGFAAVEAWRTRQPFAPRHWSPAILLGAGSILILFSPLWLSIPRVTHRQAMAMLRENRDLIAGVSRRADIDPRLLAGVVYVAQTRDHPRFTGDLIEEFQLAVSIGSELSELSMNGAPFLNASAGLCQVRPSTVGQVTWAICQSPSLGGLYSGARMAKWHKLHQPPTQPRALIPHVSIATDFPFDDFAHVPKRFRLLFRDFAMTADARTLLLSPKGSALTAAVILSLCEGQWRAAGFPIEDRPEILATLYNIGFERSHPHAEPRANDFGRRVAEFMQSPECRELFSPAEAP